MSVIRVDFHRRFKDGNINGCIINTVHDSIVCDLNTRKDVDKVRDILYNVLYAFPSNFESIFNTPFDLEVKGEIEVGDNMYDMESV